MSESRPAPKRETLDPMKGAAKKPSVKGKGAPSKQTRRKRRKPSSPPATLIGSFHSKSSQVLRRLAPPVGFVGAGLILAAALWLFVIYPAEKGPGEGRTVEVAVPKETTPGDLANRLAAAGLIRDPRVFAVWLWAAGGAGGAAPGSHLLSDEASPHQLIARLERRGFGGTARVTFPEGWNRFDMARRLQERRVVSTRGFLDAATDVPLLSELGVDAETAEGFLFPATYDFPFDSDGRDVVRRMKREFDRRWDIASRGHSASLSDVMTSARFSIRDVVTLASMIEKEAVADDERPLIASVFINRLRDPAFHPKRLECDPTASYGCLVAPEKAASCAGFLGKATVAIEHDPDNPYSTYTHEGLPPGPIANPGAKSLEAAMAPAASRFFFFVAKGEGRHAFSETFESHVAAVHAARASGSR